MTATKMSLPPPCGTLLQPTFAAIHQHGLLKHHDKNRRVLPNKKLEINLIQLRLLANLNKNVTNHFALYRVVESFEQLDASGFSTTALTDKCYSLSWLDERAQAFQHLHVWPVRIMKLEGVKLDLSSDVLL